MNYPNNLNERESIEEDIVNYDSDNQPFEKKEIPQEIVKILFYLNNYNTNLFSSIKRDYPSEIKNIINYSNKYYCINEEWMNYFLELYSYKKIKTLISEYKIKSEEELYIKIKEEEIFLNFGYNDTNIKGIKLGKFKPKKKSILNYIFNVYRSGELARYFDDFILVDKNLYDKLKQLDKNQIRSNCKKDEINENIVEIYLVDNIFIYKVNKNALGIGIPEISKNTGFPIFKIEFLIIINKKYINEEIIFNSDSEINEIFKSKDLETYLMINRGIRFYEKFNFNIIDIKFNDHNIGFLYNINGFQIEKYWKRNKEKYNKKLESLKEFKSLEMFKRKSNNKILREKEKKQDANFEETEKQKKLKLLKKDNSIKETALRWSKNYNLFENHESDQKENLRYPQNNDIPIVDKISENPDKATIDKNSVTTSETKDKLPMISKSPNPKLLLTKIKNFKAEANKQNCLLQTNANIINSFSVKLINRNEINNNINYITTNFSNQKYRLAKLHKKNNKNLDNSILTKKQKKELKKLEKKEKIKRENREKREEKEEQERNKKKQENEEKIKKAQKKRENMENKEREKNKKYLKRNNINFYYK